ncbi:MAG: signal peptidase II [Bdellovibrionota bacterium]
MKKILFLVIFITSVVLDFISKSFVVDYFKNSDTHFVPVIKNFLNIGLTFNEGVAFGFMTTWSPNVRLFALIVTSVIAFSVLLYFLFVVYRDNKIAVAFLALIFGGAVGNIIDRFRYGAVVDFIDIYYKQYHWPMFNLADSFICIGVFVLIFLPHETKEITKVEMDVDMGKDIK